MRNVCLLVIAAVLSPVLLIAQKAGPMEGNCSKLSPHDQTAIKDVIEAYRVSWLRGDGAGVRDTFASDAVLLPAHGAEPVIGLEKIKEYWWPKDAPRTEILQLDISVDRVEGDACFAYARGTDNVAWSSMQDGKIKKTRHNGTYLNVMKKLPNGSWRILQHMWDDQPNESF
jgi:uncharacterized protein (TIGR02246 family)